MKIKEEVLAKFIFSMMLLPVSIFVIYPLNALTMMLFWNWYLVPVAPVHALSFKLAFGMSLFVSCLHPNRRATKEEQEEPAWCGILRSLIILATAWGVAGLVHLIWVLG